MRTFICLEIPASIRERIGALQRELPRGEAQASWVKPGNIHLTLKFLGEVGPSRIADVRAAVEAAARTVPPFRIEVGGAGCFPSPKNPRVLWVGLKEMPEALRRLHAAIEDELAAKGFERETKRFSPHLTIARIRAPLGADRLAAELLARGFASESFLAQEVVVMRSDLNPSGSIYTPRAIVPLTGF